MRDVRPLIRHAVVQSRPDGTMLDCHAHLALPVFDSDRGEVVARARAAGVSAVVVVGEDREDSERTLDVCASHPGTLFPCAGIHPDRFADDRPPSGPEEVDAVCDLARAHRGRIVAVGEVGLDYFRARSEERRALQRAALERMVELARELGLPLNVHSRSAGHHAIELLESCGAGRALLHAFDGKVGYAQRAAEQHGWLFSIPPTVVRSTQKQKLVRALPLEALALESDSPVLGPERGVRNEPANLAVAAAHIAESRGVTVERVREATTENALRLFDRLPS